MLLLPVECQGKQGKLSFVVAFVVASVVVLAVAVLAVAFALLVVIPEEPALSEVEWGICCSSSRIYLSAGCPLIL
jgi:hypothetical protein